MDLALGRSGRQDRGMKRVDAICREVMPLSAGERASLAHDLILSLDEPGTYEAGPEQEGEIHRRVRKVRDGKAAGRVAADVLRDIEAKLARARTQT